MRTNYQELQDTMSPAAKEQARQKTEAMLKAMLLNELREARGLTQKELAVRLNVQQSSVSKMEKRTDMYISTLKSHIQALGGELDLIARFPSGEVKISNFADLGNSTHPQEM